MSIEDFRSNPTPQELMERAAGKSAREFWKEWLNKNRSRLWEMQTAEIAIGFAEFVADSQTAALREAHERMHDRLRNIGDHLDCEMCKALNS